MNIRGAAERRGRLGAALRAGRGEDGGLGPRLGVPSEPEPTALLVLALGDDDARAWLEARQQPDGSLISVDETFANDSATALAALAFGPGAARERALDYLEAARARTVPATPAVPVDPSYRGWAWTHETFGWVEPTARALLALRLLRPTAESAIEDALGLLGDRECRGGGWNYGNRIVFATPLPPYAQTTAAAVMALQGIETPLLARGLRALRRLWPREHGGLTLSMSLAALRLTGADDVPRIEYALLDLFERTGFLGDGVALAWAVLATGPTLDTLRIER